MMKHRLYIENSLLPFLFLLLGLYLLPLRLMEGLKYIPGDLGDARFNMYILEHGYLYLSGAIDSFWNANYLYPAKHVIAFSDNLLGTMPIYSLFRLLSFDKYTSFQLWILILFLLNYLSAFVALKKWFNKPLIAIIGSYIFAFGIFNLGQIYHAQIFPRFMIPITLYWFWVYLKEQNIKMLLLSTFGIIYQFYCGIYLGFFLIYGLLFLLITYIVLYRKEIISKFTFQRSFFHLFLSLGLMALLLYPLFYNYLKVAKDLGMHEFNDIVDSIPYLSSYFFVFPSSIPWAGILYEHSSYAYDLWWLHFLYPGITAWLGILIFPFVLYKDTPKYRKLGLFFFLWLFLSFIFSLRFGDFTLYELIYQLPGFASMRAVVRVVNVQVFLLILFMAFNLYRITVIYPKLKVLIYILLVFVIYDNSYRIDWNILRFSKEESKAQIKEVTKKIEEYNYADYDAIAVVLSPEITSNHSNAVDYQISVMFACQNLRINTVNGYSGNYPEGYLPFYYHVNLETLKSYITNHTDKSMEDILFIQIER